MSEQSITSGQVVSIKTLANNHCRVEIDIQPEHTPNDLINWRFQMVAIAVLDEKAIQEKENEVVKRTGKPVRR